MSFLDYYNANGDEHECVIYTVVTYGCNSTPSDLWPAQTHVFTDFAKAHEYYLQIRPDMLDLDNYAEEHTSPFDPTSDLTKPCVTIKGCRQLPGYPKCGQRESDGAQISYAKRPYGVALNRCIVNQTS